MKNSGKISRYLKFSMQFSRSEQMSKIICKCNKSNILFTSFERLQSLMAEPLLFAVFTNEMIHPIPLLSINSIPSRSKIILMPEVLSFGLSSDFTSSVTANVNLERLANWAIFMPSFSVSLIIMFCFSLVKLVISNKQEAKHCLPVLNFNNHKGIIKCLKIKICFINNNESNNYNVT